MTEDWVVGPRQPSQTLRCREMKFPGGSVEMNWVIVPGERSRLGVGWVTGRGLSGDLVGKHKMVEPTGVATWGFQPQSRGDKEISGMQTMGQEGSPSVREVAQS